MHEVRADWDREWRATAVAPAAVDAEERTPRWRTQERLVAERFGGFQGVRAIEVGAGRGLNGLLYARRGAEVTLLDTSAVVLEQARELYAAQGLGFEPVLADLFAPPSELLDAHDVAMSFGLCEHFLGDRRRDVIASHLRLVRPGGLVLLGVPNRYAPAYRVWMATLKRRGTWRLGTEEPFSVRELSALARAAGGEPLAPAFGSFVASLVDHGVNQVLFKLGRRGLRVPQPRVPVLDRLAYELLLPVVRPSPAEI